MVKLSAPDRLEWRRAEQELQKATANRIALEQELAQLQHSLSEVRANQLGGEGGGKTERHATR